MQNILINYPNKGHVRVTDGVNCMKPGNSIENNIKEEFTAELSSFDHVTLLIR